MPEPTLDLLTADGEALRRWFDKRDCEQRDNRAVFVQMRDAIVAAARSAPVGELTEADLAGILREWDRENPPAQIGAAHSDAAAIAAFPLTASAVRITARRLARPSDAVLAEARREGWDAARAFANEKWGITPRPEHWDAERDRRWPAPPKPTPSVTLSDGREVRPSVKPGIESWYEWKDGECVDQFDNWRDIPQNGADFDAVKALAAQVAPERAK